MIDILVGGIVQNNDAIKKLTKNINIKFILFGVGLFAVGKMLQDQNNRIDTIEEELSELNTKGE